MPLLLLLPLPPWNLIPPPSTRCPPVEMRPWMGQQLNPRRKLTRTGLAQRMNLDLDLDLDLDLNTVSAPFLLNY